MLYDDVLGELMAIQGYQKIISSTNDEKIIEIISRIKLDEELHVLALEKRLSELS
jgi:rubrerythrin